MAFCPKCKGAMGPTEARCPHCGYDFPPDPKAHRKGLAYSALAEVALVVGTFAAALGCLVALCGISYAVYVQDWWTALLFGPLAFFLQLAMLVVFLRVQHV